MLQKRTVVSIDKYDRGPAIIARAFHPEWAGGSILKCIMKWYPEEIATRGYG